MHLKLDVIYPTINYERKNWTTFGLQILDISSEINLFSILNTFLNTETKSWFLDKLKNIVETVIILDHKLYIDHALVILFLHTNAPLVPLL